MDEDSILRPSSVENPGSEQIIVPRNLTFRVLQMLHEDPSHFGTAKTSARVKEKRRNGAGTDYHARVGKPSICKRSSAATNH